MDGWDIVLPLDTAEDEGTVAIPDSAVTLGDGPYTAKVWRVIRDINAAVVLLRPEDAPEVQLLRAVLPETMTAEPGNMVRFTLLVDKCLCFCNQQET